MPGDIYRLVDSSCASLRQGWVDFLASVPFDGWGTVTFRLPARSASAAIVRGGSLIRRICRRKGQPFFAFVVAEPFKMGGYHAHFLIATGLVEPWRKQFFRELSSRLDTCAGFSRCDGLKDSEAVRGYVAKYLVKGSGEWRFYGKKPDGVGKAAGIEVAE